MDGPLVDQIDLKKARRDADAEISTGRSKLLDGVKASRVIQEYQPLTNGEK